MRPPDCPFSPKNSLRFWKSDQPVLDSNQKSFVIKNPDLKNHSGGGPIPRKIGSDPPPWLGRVVHKSYTPQRIFVQPQEVNLRFQGIEVRSREAPRGINDAGHKCE